MKKTSTESTAEQRFYRFANDTSRIFRLYVFYWASCLLLPLLFDKSSGRNLPRRMKVDSSKKIGRLKKAIALFFFYRFRPIVEGFADERQAFELMLGALPGDRLWGYEQPKSEHFAIDDCIDGTGKMPSIPVYEFLDFRLGEMEILRRIESRDRVSIEVLWISGTFAGKKFTVSDSNFFTLALFSTEVDLQDGNKIKKSTHIPYRVHKKSAVLNFFWYLIFVVVSVLGARLL